ncbi:MAG TPA: hypothetical protein VGF68_07570 [Solirubrobacteraceae bacterium]|jgi:hypothetical protein
MDDAHSEGNNYPREDVFEGDALIDLGIDRAYEIDRMSVVRPSGLTIIDMGSFAIAIEVWKPLSEGLPYSMDVRHISKRNGTEERVADRHPIDPVSSMPDGGAINRALDLVLEWMKSDAARFRARRTALKLLDWLGRTGPSRELLDLIEDDCVTASCELDGKDVIYRLEVWAGSNPGLDPSHLFGK